MELFQDSWKEDLLRSGISAMVQAVYRQEEKGPYDKSAQVAPRDAPV